MMAMDPYPGFDGKFFSMPCRNVVPKPVQKPHPPIHCGGESEAALRRAVRDCNGWLGLNHTLEQRLSANILLIPMLILIPGILGIIFQESKFLTTQAKKRKAAMASRG